MEQKIQNTEVSYCKRCGRRLKGQESKERGYGPTCFDKIKKERLSRNKLFKIGC